MSDPMYALIDPNWGQPKAIASTRRETVEDAWAAAILCEEASLYSGRSQFPLPNGTPGKRSRLEASGYRVLPVDTDNNILDI
ncbi:hypothetical protein [Salipiger sp. PrR003]|uniref:hypothetical protein n=1 Tax=Salipiger sp. PrR003 TaxID=2706776 RepID=UPI0013DCC823|nr:hypothetical protein [Salipiger sp. PrR003]NDV50174.1 hypothetical protein [Salipiger sp. PrR003]